MAFTSLPLDPRFMEIIGDVTERKRSKKGEQTLIRAVRELRREGTFPTHFLAVFFQYGANLYRNKSRQRKV